MKDFRQNDVVRVVFDKKLIIEKIKADSYLFYSPFLGKWFMGDYNVKILIEAIIESEGIIDFEALRRILGSECRISKPEHIDRWIKKLLYTPLFFENEKEFYAERKKFKKMYEISPKQSPRTAYLHLTHRCNFNCSYCYNKGISKGEKKELSTHTWKNIILKLKNVGVNTFIFTGGEPLMRKDLENVISEVKKENEMYHVRVLTNGSLLIRDRIEKLLPMVDKFIISIDSTDIAVQKRTRSAKGFDIIRKAIDYLGSNAPKKIRTRSVLTNQNIHYAVMTARILKEQYNVIDHELTLRLPNSAEEIDLIPDISEIKKIEKEIPTFESKGLMKYQKARCGAATMVIAIDMQGNIYPCQSLLEVEEFKLGNITEHNWYSSFSSSPVREIFRSLSVDNREGHKDCLYRYICGGGCPAIAWKVYKKLDSFLPFFCEFNRFAAKKRILNQEVGEI